MAVRVLSTNWAVVRPVGSAVVLVLRAGDLPTGFCGGDLGFSDAASAEASPRRQRKSRVERTRAVYCFSGRMRALERNR